MQYSNFIMKNNVHATLSTALSSIATTIQLTTGQGSRFGTEFPQIATLESFDDTGKVIKREIVQITARNGDDLTVVRAFAPCPANDDANSQSQSSVSFSADDQISLYIPKEIFDKISQSMNDIYDNGTNNMRTDIVSGLQVEVNPGSVLVGSAYYDFAGGTITLTDNATNYLEIDEDGNLANNTTSRNDQNTKLAIITTAGGEVTNIQDWRLGTVGGKIGGVNIHDLTEKTKLSINDEFIVADSENIYNNKKVLYSDVASLPITYSPIYAGIRTANEGTSRNPFCFSDNLEYMIYSNAGHITLTYRGKVVVINGNAQHLVDAGYIGTPYYINSAYPCAIYKGFIYCCFSNYGNGGDLIYLYRCQLGLDITQQSNRELLWSYSYGTIVSVDICGIDDNYIYVHDSNSYIITKLDIVNGTLIETKDTTILGEVPRVVINGHIWCCTNNGYQKIIKAEYDDLSILLNVGGAITGESSGYKQYISCIGGYIRNQDYYNANQAPNEMYVFAKG